MISFEIKARCPNPDRIRELLKSRNASSQGEDRQVDTYFKVQRGRLKLRKRNIENSLIFYERQDIEGPRKSEIILIKDPSPSLKDILSKALGILVVVDKEREIYFVDNVKFNLDTVQGVGTFAEIEAFNENASKEESRLFEQCRFYLDLFGIPREDLVSDSYSDLLLKQRGMRKEN